MNIEKFKKERNELNEKLFDSDRFFELFGDLNDRLFSDGAITKKYKELTGLPISILTRCDECILYHL